MNCVLGMEPGHLHNRFPHRLGGTAKVDGGSAASSTEAGNACSRTLLFHPSWAGGGSSIDITPKKICHNILHLAAEYKGGAKGEWDGFQEMRWNFLWWKREVMSGFLTDPGHEGPH